MRNLSYGHLTLYHCPVKDSDINLAIDTDFEDDRTKCLQYSGEYVRRAKSVLSCTRKHKSIAER
jgi:hypothetical protein